MQNYRIEQFIKELNLKIPFNHLGIEEIFNFEYDYLELDSLRDEVCKCIICGLNQAAMTLTNHLLESSLKKCLIMRFSIENKNDKTELTDTFKDGIDLYDDKLLDETINRACSQGLITKKKLLKSSKMILEIHILMHQLIKIFKDKKVKGSVVSMTEKEKENPEKFIKRLFQAETKELPIKAILPVHGLAQVDIARESILPYFSEVDKTIREMLKKLKPNS